MLAKPFTTELDLQPLVDFITISSSLLKIHHLLICVIYSIILICHSRKFSDSNKKQKGENVGDFGK